MGTFSRIRYVISANVNALLERAEDPEKLLRALIREMEDAGEDARLAVADLLAERQHLERLEEQLERETREWNERAEKAVATDRDDLARAALRAKSELAEALASNRGEHTVLNERIDQLEGDMTTLKTKLAEAKRKLKDMHASTGAAPAAPARSAPSQSPGERKLREAMNRFDRLQSQVERLEARVRSYEVGGVAPAAWADETEQTDPAIEAELEALKARVSGPAGPKTAAAESRTPAEATEA